MRARNKDGQAAVNMPAATMPRRERVRRQINTAINPALAIYASVPVAMTKFQLLTGSAHNNAP